ncbi:peptidyl-prolyl cis-trans isomerase FKBP16-1, chloroplastic isoform X3 [Durio zibethinus]|uniref:peptidylprolyl isomerase n=1 Tax=Durio zibethinus TaxID=66656 RepID=A0A6P5WMK6_DURZI|nr:peptidyl-prolyl cis-trans isomerase FKBP16-1, chloroplastic isoform X3 [Durio zibethinus]
MQLQALSFRTLVQLPCFFNLPPSKQPKDVMTRHLHNRHPSVTVKSLPRRVLLQLMGFGPISLCIYPVCAAPMQEMKDPEVIRTLKLPSGVRIQEIIEGKGPEAHDGDCVQVNYVCRRSNGYFVHSTVDQFSGESSPVTLPLDENQIIKGLKDVLTGMRVGGKRRALIPPSVGYIKENLEPIPDEFGPRRSLLSHAKEPLIFEVQLLKIL